ncbi:MAG TPA: class I SAM-dependent methyltransferase [Thermoanaerobaculia bacterium]|nr:class I SAM-dependent methyltransferase [Thermoanaerobaculia bacterium]
MRWFTSSAVDKRQDPAPPAGPETQVHRSLALTSLFEEIRHDHKLQVLDLGCAVGSNVEFLSRFDCKLYIEDLYAALVARAPAGPEAEEAGPQFFAEFLPLPESTRFDVVLAWDTFNYLTRKELGHLIRHLRKFCQPGTVVFALMSTLKQIPAQPIRFRIVDEERLAYEPRTLAQRPSPRFAPAEIGDLLSGFRVDRSFLLRHGIQEYLFVREPEVPERRIAQPMVRRA